MAGSRNWNWKYKSPACLPIGVPVKIHLCPAFFVLLIILSTRKTTDVYSNDQLVKSIVEKTNDEYE